MAEPLETLLLPKVLPDVGFVMLFGVDAKGGVPAAGLLPPTEAWPLTAARKVVASLVASAFFKYTTWMLPLALVLPGWSSLATSERTSATRAGLAARKMRALLRGSANKVVL